jgi:hypothetical protein
MFAFMRKPKLTESDADYLARLRPGMLIIERNFIKVYLADVDVMSTIYVKTKKMSREDALELVKRQTATDRHPQLYI